jgi:hypothetical protein
MRKSLGLCAYFIDICNDVLVRHRNTTQGVVTHESELTDACESEPTHEVD